MPSPLSFKQHILTCSLISSSGDLSLRVMASLHWILDIEKGLADLIGNGICTLIKSQRPTPEEELHEKWLDSKLLRSGFDDTPTGLELHKKEFLDELINMPTPETESEAHALAVYMNRHITSKKPLASVGGEIGKFFLFIQETPNLPCIADLDSVYVVAKVERAVVAVLLKHNQLVNEAMTFAHWLINNPSALEVKDQAPLPASLQTMWEVAYEIRAWLVQQQHKHRLEQQEQEETDETENR